MNIKVKDQLSHFSLSIFTSSSTNFYLHRNNSIVMTTMKHWCPVLKHAVFFGVSSKRRCNDTSTLLQKLTDRCSNYVSPCLRLTTSEFYVNEVWSLIHEFISEVLYSAGNTSVLVFPDLCINMSKQFSINKHIDEFKQYCPFYIFILHSLRQFNPKLGNNHCVKINKTMNNEHLEYVPNNVTLYCNLITESIINVVIVSLCLFWYVYSSKPQIFNFNNFKFTSLFILKIYQGNNRGKN